MANREPLYPEGGRTNSHEAFNGTSAPRGAYSHMVVMGEAVLDTSRVSAEGSLHSAMGEPGSSLGVCVCVRGVGLGVCVCVCVCVCGLSR